MTVENTSGRKRTRYFVCDVCGHTWQSYGLGKNVRCPKCYENRTGKRLGRDLEGMAAMRAAKKARDPQTNIYDFIPPDQNGRVDLTPPPLQERESFLSRLLNKEIL